MKGKACVPKAGEPFCMLHSTRKEILVREWCENTTDITGNLFLDRSILQERNGGGGAHKRRTSPTGVSVAGRVVAVGNA